jgi:type II secretory pathway pseudopilin PulG
MVVVAIIGVLAVIGVTMLRTHVESSKTVEATSVIQAIRAAQERWRAETQAYLSVSTSLTSWYPTATPGKTKYHWVQPSGNDYANWRLLAVNVNVPVQFGYTTVAGAAGAALPVLSTAQKPTWATPVEPWYVIQAKADADADGSPALYAATSVTGEIYVENEGE